MVQPDVVLEVDSPANSFLRPLTPGEFHLPTAGTARFGKISQGGIPSAFKMKLHKRSI